VTLDFFYFSYPFDGTGFILAHAYYPYEFGAFGGDIHFDEDEDWRPNAVEVGDGLDFFTVAVMMLHSFNSSLITILPYLNEYLKTKAYF